MVTAAAGRGAAAAARRSATAGTARRGVGYSDAGHSATGRAIAQANSRTPSPPPIRDGESDDSEHLAPGVRTPPLTLAAPRRPAAATVAAANAKLRAAPHIAVQPNWEKSAVGPRSRPLAPLNVELALSDLCVTGSEPVAKPLLPPPCPGLVGGRPSPPPGLPVPAVPVPVGPVAGSAKPPTVPLPTPLAPLAPPNAVQYQGEPAPEPPPAPEAAWPSEGSKRHPVACQGACRYVKRKGGCRDGARCRKCHLCFWRRDGEKDHTGDEGLTAEAVTAEVLPPSGGTAGHPERCGAPCRYVWRKGGCRNGANCPNCHACFWRRGKAQGDEEDDGEEDVEEAPATPRVAPNQPPAEPLEGLIHAIQQFIDCKLAQALPVAAAGAGTR